MATLKILIFPDPRLRTVAEPIREVDNSIAKLVEDMFELMRQDSLKARLDSILND